MTTQEPTPQQKMQAALAKSGIPAKEIKVYGSQIMITAWSFEAAQKWASLLKKLNPSKIRTGQGIDYAKENKGTNLCPSTIKVWRVWATL